MKLLLAGDSTVANQPVLENTDLGLMYCGWGQKIEAFLSHVPVHNFAVSGYTVTAFREKGQYEKLLKILKPGDYAFFQFGHNDQKVEALAADGGYADALRQFIKEIRDVHGQPVLVTSAARNTWHNEYEYNDLLINYANAMKHVAAKNDVPLLDLHDASMQWLISLGLKGAKRYFYPGDYTHPNPYGGCQWAKMVATLICEHTHPAMRRLQAALKPQKDWPIMDIDASAADPVTGWLFPPENDTNEVLETLYKNVKM